MKREYIDLNTVMPEMEGDKFKINHFKVELSPLDIARASMRGNIGLTREHMIDPLKTYTRLIEKGSGIWMSDTPMETETNKEFLRKANGDVLIFGLGIGLIIFPLLNDPNVTSITVVELEQELIDLTGSVIKKAKGGDKVTIIKGDAYAHGFPKAKKFDTIYFDIWQDISSDNYAESVTLHKRYRKNINYKNPDRYVDSWVRDECLRMKKVERREKDYYNWRY